MQSTSGNTIIIFVLFWFRCFALLLSRAHAGHFHCSEGGLHHLHYKVCTWLIQRLSTIHLRISIQTFHYKSHGLAALRLVTRMYTRLLQRPVTNQHIADCPGTRYQDKEVLSQCFRVMSYLCMCVCLIFVSLTIGVSSRDLDIRAKKMNTRGATLSLGNLPRFGVK